MFKVQRTVGAFEQTNQVYTHFLTYSNQLWGTTAQLAISGSIAYHRRERFSACANIVMSCEQIVASSASSEASLHTTAAAATVSIGSAFCQCHRVTPSAQPLPAGQRVTYELTVITFKTVRRRSSVVITSVYGQRTIPE